MDIKKIFHNIFEDFLIRKKVNVEKNVIIEKKGEIIKLNIVNYIHSFYRALEFCNKAISNYSIPSILEYIYYDFSETTDEKKSL